jgi:hypothetical protein
MATQIEARPIGREGDDIKVTEIRIVWIRTNSG